MPTTRVYVIFDLGLFDARRIGHSKDEAGGGNLVLSVNQGKRIAAFRSSLFSTVLAVAVFNLGFPLVAHGKDSAGAKMDLGDLMFFNGNTEGAIRAYKRCIEIDPTFLDGHLRLLNMYVQKNDITGAIDECNAILQVKPGHKDTLMALGNLLRLQNDLDGAQKAFEHAIEAGANPAMAEHALGLTLLQKGDVDGAHQHVTEALKHQKKFPEAHMTLGVIKFKKGDKVGCMEHFDEAIRSKPINPEAHNAKADILAADGKWKEAREEYKQAVKEEPKYAQAWSSLGNAEFQLGDMKAAREAYAKAKTLAPNDKNIAYGLALSLEKIGQTEEAIKEFQNGLMLEEDTQMKGQIQMHIQQLGGGGSGGFNLGGVGAGAGTIPGAADQNPFGFSFGDMIQLKPPSSAEGSKKAESGGSKKAEAGQPDRPKETVKETVKGVVLSPNKKQKDTP